MTDAGNSSLAAQDAPAGAPQAPVEVPTPQWTPGPWVSRGRYVGTPKHMSFIAECRDSHGCWSTDYKSKANAHLIAAAPELADSIDVEALEAIADEIGVEGQHTARAHSLRIIAAKQRAALAKARGDSQ